MKPRGHIAVMGSAAAIAAAVLLCAPSALGQSLEYPVKAAYLSKFGPFVTWPESAFESPSSPFRICVSGVDPFGAALDRSVANVRIGGHPVQVRRMETVVRGSGCMVLYISPSKRQTVDEALRAVKGEPVLTVTDSTQPSTSRGAIHFVVRDNRVRFEIDDRTAAQSGLAISSKLLNLATAVRPRA